MNAVKTIRAVVDRFSVQDCKTMTGHTLDGGGVR